MTEEIPGTEFAILLGGALEQQNIGLNELAKAMGPSYEYFRRILRGTAVPTDPLIRMMAEYLGWDYAEVQQVAVRDRMRIKFGKVGLAAMGVNPETETFQRSWAYLTNEQKEILLMQLKNFLASNSKTGFAAAEVDRLARETEKSASSSRKKKAARG